VADEELNDETDKIMFQIDHGQNFLLSGGAGSGKTYSLNGMYYLY
jgi:DNA helicase-2/ATP-dependent DNA helicase PcrA